MVSFVSLHNTVLPSSLHCCCEGGERVFIVFVSSRLEHVDFILGFFYIWYPSYRCITRYCGVHYVVVVREGGERVFIVFVSIRLEHVDSILGPFLHSVLHEGECIMGNMSVLIPHYALPFKRSLLRITPQGFY